MKRSDLWDPSWSNYLAKVRVAVERATGEVRFKAGEREVIGDAHDHNLPVSEAVRLVKSNRLHPGSRRPTHER